MDPAVERVSELLKEAGLLDPDADLYRDEFSTIRGTERAGPDFRIGVERVPARNTISVVITTDAEVANPELEAIFSEVQEALEATGEFERTRLSTGRPQEDTEHEHQLAFDFEILVNELQI